MRIGTQELIIIVIIALVIFGPKQLPQLGKAMGKTLGSFKSGLKETAEKEDEEDEEEEEEEEKPAPKKKKAEKKEDEA